MRIYRKDRIMLLLKHGPSTVCPCPFCGGEAQSLYYRVWTEYDDVSKNVSWSCSCCTAGFCAKWRFGLSLRWRVVWIQRVKP
jgi:hypothetical protein